MPDRETRVLALKASFRDLIRACGGQERCAELLGISQSRISEASSINHMDKSPRLDHVMILEADCRSPIVTRFMADASHHRVVSIEPGKTQDPHLHLAQIIGGNAKAAMGLAGALADGRIMPSEALALKAQALAALDNLQSYLGELDRIIKSEDAA